MPNNALQSDMFYLVYFDVDHTISVINKKSIANCDEGDTCNCQVKYEKNIYSGKIVTKGKFL